MIASVSIISKPSLNRETPAAASTSSTCAISAARRMTPSTSHAGTSPSAQSVGQPSRAPPSSPPSNRIASGKPKPTSPPRGAMGGNRVCHSVHAGKERPPRRHQRLVGFQNHGEFDQIVAPHPDKRSRAAIGRDRAAVNERVAKFTQRNQGVARGQIECLLQVRKTRRHRRIHPYLLCNPPWNAIPAK